MTCSRPVCEKPCSWDCPRERAEARDAWFKARVKGKMIGPLERYANRWLELVIGNRDGGWPRGAEQCRDAEPDAAIGSAKGT